MMEENIEENTEEVGRTFADLLCPSCTSQGGKRTSKRDQVKYDGGFMVRRVKKKGLGKGLRMVGFECWNNDFTIKSVFFISFL